ncbi:MAG: Rpn family recombination-promoting nuclease/putative transposase [Lactobacillus sp.]
MNNKKKKIIVDPSERSITKDIVFGHVMSKPKNCLQLLQRIMPELRITSVDVTPQQIIDEGANEKSVRLDIMATDEQGRIYDIEMQVARQDYIGQRLRYYQAQLDKHSLDRGVNYADIKDTYIIFLCPYDPFYHNYTRYEFSPRENHNPSIKIETGAHWIFLNSKGANKDINKGLQQFLDLMNGKIDDADAFIAQLNKEIDHYVGSRQWENDRKALNAKMQDSERKGKREGLEEALKETASVMKQSGSDDDVFKTLKKIYHNYFSDEEIRKLMDEAK